MVRSGVGVGMVAVVVVIGLLAAQQFRPATDPGMGNLTCADTQMLLQDYASGRLDAETAANVEIHLANCPDCRVMYEQTRVTPGKAATRALPGDWLYAAYSNREFSLLAVRDSP
jgi:hypothetical protein